LTENVTRLPSGVCGRATIAVYAYRFRYTGTLIGGIPELASRQEITEEETVRISWMRNPTEEEIRQLVQSYPEARLRENYAIAARHPGTEWHRILLAEMRQRSLGED